MNATEKPVPCPGCQAAITHPRAICEFCGENLLPEGLSPALFQVLSMHQVVQELDHLHQNGQLAPADHQARRHHYEIQQKIHLAQLDGPWLTQKGHAIKHAEAKSDHEIQSEGQSTALPGKTDPAAAKKAALHGKNATSTTGHAITHPAHAITHPAQTPSTSAGDGALNRAPLAGDETTPAPIKSPPKSRYHLPPPLDAAPETHSTGGQGEMIPWMMGAALTVIGTFYSAAASWPFLSAAWQNALILFLISLYALAFAALSKLMAKRQKNPLGHKVLGLLSLSLWPAAALPLSRFMADTPILGLGLAGGIYALAHLIIRRQSGHLLGREKARFGGLYLILALMPIMLSALPAPWVLAYLALIPLFIGLGFYRALNAHRPMILGLLFYAFAINLGLSLLHSSGGDFSPLLPLAPLLAMALTYLDEGQQRWQGLRRVYWASPLAALALVLALSPLFYALFDAIFGHLPRLMPALLTACAAVSLHYARRVYQRPIFGHGAQILGVLALFALPLAPFGSYFSFHRAVTGPTPHLSLHLSSLHLALIWALLPLALVYRHQFIALKRGDWQGLTPLFSLLSLGILGGLLLSPGPLITLICPITAFILSTRLLAQAQGGQTGFIWRAPGPYLMVQGVAYMVAARLLVAPLANHPILLGAGLWAFAALALLIAKTLKKRSPLPFHRPWGPVFITLALLGFEYPLRALLNLEDFGLLLPFSLLAIPHYLFSRHHHHQRGLNLARALAILTLFLSIFGAFTLFPQTQGGIFWAALISTGLLMKMAYEKDGRVDGILALIATLITYSLSPQLGPSTFAALERQISLWMGYGGAPLPPIWKASGYTGLIAAWQLAQWLCHRQNRPQLARVVGHGVRIFAFPLLTFILFNGDARLGLYLVPAYLLIGAVHRSVMPAPWQIPLAAILAALWLSHIVVLLPGPSPLFLWGLAGILGATRIVKPSMNLSLFSLLCLAQIPLFLAVHTPEAGGLIYSLSLILLLLFAVQITWRRPTPWTVHLLAAVIMVGLPALFAPLIGGISGLFISLIGMNLTLLTLATLRPLARWHESFAKAQSLSLMGIFILYLTLDWAGSTYELAPDGAYYMMALGLLGLLAGLIRRRGWMLYPGFFFYTVGVHIGPLFGPDLGLGGAILAQSLPLFALVYLYTQSTFYLRGPHLARHGRRAATLALIPVLLLTLFQSTPWPLIMGLLPIVALQRLFHRRGLLLIWAALATLFTLAQPLSPFALAWALALTAIVFFWRAPHRWQIGQTLYNGGWPLFHEKPAPFLAGKAPHFALLLLFSQCLITAFIGESIAYTALLALFGLSLAKFCPRSHRLVVVIPWPALLLGALGFDPLIAFTALALWAFFALDIPGPWARKRPFGLAFMSLAWALTLVHLYDGGRLDGILSSPLPAAILAGIALFILRQTARPAAFYGGVFTLWLTLATAIANLGLILSTGRHTLTILPPFALMSAGIFALLYRFEGRWMTLYGVKSRRIYSIFALVILLLTGTFCTMPQGHTLGDQIMILTSLLLPLMLTTPKALGRRWIGSAPCMATLIFVMALYLDLFTPLGVVSGQIFIWPTLNLALLALAHLAKMQSNTPYAQNLGRLARLFSLFMPLFLTPTTPFSTTSLAITGSLFVLHHLATAQNRWMVLSLLLFNLSLFSVYSRLGWFEPQLYAIPLGLSCLAVAHLNRHILSRNTLNLLRYGGAALIYIVGFYQSIFSPWHTLLLLSLGALGLASGLILKVKSYVFMSSGFMAAALIVNLARFGLRHRQFWAISLTAFGLFILLIMVLWSLHRPWLHRLYDRMRVKLSGMD